MAEVKTQPQEILHSVRGPDGSRVPLLPETTYQRALAAAEKIMLADRIEAKKEDGRSGNSA